MYLCLIGVGPSDVGTLSVFSDVTSLFFRLLLLLLTPLSSLPLRVNEPLWKSVFKEVFLPVVFLDDDDLFYSDHIEVLVSALIKNKKASAAYSLAFEVPTDIVNKKRDYVEGLYFTHKLF